ncbi:virulence RhuM family protein [Gilvimarinus agarilyticus]|uniref:virulence RhuM family protein n=1 Tax=Gilvimarinus sp. 2_MG-2023 TaxID=3062666 RepID=UPI001C087D23|nr:virulence RhuM family protein [Gilvimarinus sp. 2_MG-2023]MBU2887485.1 virulence RhuM family protein [Gilvimarinus agarilyticus]MDO6572137.1 virulence RhuM family protein [Gilvimarinus sp. 2_MG-2023]
MESRAEFNQPMALFTSIDGQVRLQLKLSEQSLWLTQRQIAELFEKSPKTISEHITNIYEDGELDPAATIRKFRTVAREGTRDVERLLDHYNLEAVLAVGYRVRSSRGTQFRQWATQVLKEYLVKGFAMDDERLKNPDKAVSDDYFDELLERIRDIRASERRFYQKITDIYATASDYNARAPLSQQFFASVQNKLHWAIHGYTAAELIVERADITKPNMGLTSWQGTRVGKTDVSIAKNYLTQEELSSLNRIVTMYLDYAENQASKRRPMTMQDWADKLDAFLAFNEHQVLQDAGKVTAEVAKQLAEQTYEAFAEHRRIEQANAPSDFDAFLAQSKDMIKPTKPD